MKTLINKLLVSLFVSILIFAIGCNEETKTDVIPQTVTGTQTGVATATGMSYSNGIDLVFDSNMLGFSIDTLPFDSAHDCTKCTSCGIVDVDGTKAYKIFNGNHSSAGAGMTITLDTPIKTDILSGITFTLKTSSNDTLNRIRVSRYDSTSMGNYINNPPSLSGFADKWKTVDIGIDTMKELADSDGYIKSFSFYVRNYDKTDIYISKISFEANFDSLCNPEIDPKKCTSEKETVQYIADAIKDNLQEIGVGATVEVTCTSYTPNTSKYEGNIEYLVDLIFSNTKYLTDTISQNIPIANKMWMAENNDLYYASQIIKTKDKKFDVGGVLSIDKIKIKAGERIKYIEYACITQDKNYMDEDIQWYDVHKVSISGNKIKKLFVNAFLDYGSSLVEGSKYRFVMRTVTENENYILNFDQEFTYRHYDSNICNAMLETLSYLQNAQIECGQTDKSVSLKNNIENEIKDGITVDVTCTGEGIHASNFTVVIKSATDTAFQYKGAAFVVEKFVARHDSSASSKNISLVSPIDGLKDIVLAQEYIVSHFTNPYTMVVNPNYEFYSPIEICTPPAITFKWKDTNKNPEEQYRLLIADNISFENAIEYRTGENSFDVYNLQPGKQYYWKICCGTEESVVSTFTIATGYTRFLKIDGVYNIRDLGGYVNADGKSVKYGLLYRSANMDGISKSGITELRDRLGVKTDVDYRGDQGKSSLGNSVNYIPIAIKWYHGIFTEEALPLIRDAIVLHANKENYPIDFHCAIGRDRTGTMSFIILGLLGMDEETLVREYHLSLYSQTGDYSPQTQKSLYEGNIMPFIAGLRKYGDEGDSLSACIEKFALAIGVTQEEINSIRNILLEDAPEQSYQNNGVKEQNHNIIFEDKQGCTSSMAKSQIMILIASVVILKKIIGQIKRNFGTS